TTGIVSAGPDFCRILGPFCALLASCCCCCWLFAPLGADLSELAVAEVCAEFCRASLSRSSWAIRSTSRMYSNCADFDKCFTAVGVAIALLLIGAFFAKLFACCGCLAAESKFFPSEASWTRCAVERSISLVSSADVPTFVPVDVLLLRTVFKNISSCSSNRTPGDGVSPDVAFCGEGVPKSTSESESDWPSRMTSFGTGRETNVSTMAGSFGDSVRDTGGDGAAAVRFRLINLFGLLTSF
uniref:Transmembrane protein n=1 Tax=Anopheles dirus TaxID=7168 RepID=A0A182NW87_9DIPT